MRKAIFFDATKLFVICLSIVLTMSGCADLVVTNIHHAQYTGAYRQIKFSVKNEGVRPAPASTTRVWIQPVTESSFTRQLTRATPALGPGQEIELATWPLYGFELPSPNSGQCAVIKACADDANTVDENWMEGNNCLARSFCAANPNP